MLGPFRNEVGNDAHVEIREVAHVGDVLLADLAGADDSDDDRTTAAGTGHRGAPSTVVA